MGSSSQNNVILGCAYSRAQDKGCFRLPGFAPPCGTAPGPDIAITAKADSGYCRLMTVFYIDSFLVYWMRIFEVVPLQRRRYMPGGRVLRDVMPVCTIWPLML